MWNKREEEAAHAAAAAPQTVSSPGGVGESRREGAAIGPSISIVGDLTGAEDLMILGKVEGKVDLPQHSVTVGRSGRVSADIHAKVVSVEGEVRGNLLAGEQILIRKTATMLGNLTAPRVGLEDGCRFKGSVDMEAPQKPSATVAPVARPSGVTSLAKPAETPTQAVGGPARP